MKKQEAIEEIKDEIKRNGKRSGSLDYLNGKRDGLVDALKIIKQIDEPEKPVVPRFVADYIDSEQYSCSTLSEALDNMDDEKRILDWFYINSETFAKAWLYGYEVEKEKLYTVKFSNEDFGKTYIGIIKTANKIGISTVPLNDECSKCYFTKSELEEFKFWNNPAFEIKEVTE